MTKEIRQLPEETVTTTSDWYILQKASNNQTSKVSGTNLVPASSIQDSKLIHGKLRYRQGGSATNWNTAGTTTYDYSTVNIYTQAGCANATDNTVNASNGWYATSAQTVTFPITFAQKPIVLLTSLSDHAVCSVNSTTASSFIWKGRASTNINAGVDMMWIAIGQ